MSKVLLCYEDFSELMTTQTVLKKVGFDVVPISSEFGLTQQVLSFNPDIVIGFGKGPKVSTVGVGRRLKEMPRWTGSVLLIFAPGSKPAPAELARIRMDMALEAPLEITRLVQVLANFTNQDPHALVERMMKSAAQEAANIQTARATSEQNKNNDTVFVSGTAKKEESWNVTGNADIDEFNRLMGNTPPATVGAKALKGNPGDAESAQYVASGSPELEKPQSPRVPTAAPARPTPAGKSSPADGQIPPEPVNTEAVRALLQDAQAKVHEKVKGYEKFLKAPIAVAKSTLRRTETRKAQKDLRKNWDDDDLKSQDLLRRQFTKAMFKKKD